MSAIPLTKALKEWEKLHDKVASEATDIRICGGISLDEGHSRSFINKLDASLNTLASCERLSLSTNMIDKLYPFTGMTKLRVLSLGRNSIKKLEKLDDLAPTLEELWISYNSISSLDGVLPLTKLQVLYCSNNAIKDWGEIEKLSALTELREVLFRGNPIYTDLADDAAARLQVVKHLPSLQKVDAKLVSDADRTAAAEH